MFSNCNYFPNLSCTGITPVEEEQNSIVQASESGSRSKIDVVQLDEDPLGEGAGGAQAAVEETNSHDITCDDDAFPEGTYEEGTCEGTNDDGTYDDGACDDRTCDNGTYDDGTYEDYGTNEDNGYSFQTEGKSNYSESFESYDE